MSINEFFYYIVWLVVVVNLMCVWFVVFVNFIRKYLLMLWLVRLILLFLNSVFLWIYSLFVEINCYFWFLFLYIFVRVVVVIFWVVFIVWFFNDVLKGFYLGYEKNYGVFFLILFFIISFLCDMLFVFSVGLWGEFLLGDDVVLYWRNEWYLM